MGGAALRVEPHIGIVIAGDGGDPLRRAEGAKPFGGKDEFLRQAEIHEISGDRDVVRLAADEVLHQHVEHIAAMHELPPAMPIHVAEHALAEKIAAPCPRHRAQMDVGQMGEGEQWLKTTFSTDITPKHIAHTT